MFGDHPYVDLRAADLIRRIASGDKQHLHATRRANQAFDVLPQSHRPRAVRAIAPITQRRYGVEESAQRATLYRIWGREHQECLRRRQLDAGCRRWKGRRPVDHAEPGSGNDRRNRNSSGNWVQTYPDYSYLDGCHTGDRAFTFQSDHYFVFNLKVHGSWRVSQHRQHDRPHRIVGTDALGSATHLQRRQYPAAELATKPRPPCNPIRRTARSVSAVPICSRGAPDQGVAAHSVRNSSEDIS